MSGSFDWKRVEASWRLGFLLTDDLPRIASEAFEHGYQSQTLTDLAGCRPGENEEASRIFERLLIEMGGGDMTNTDALRQYAIHVSTLILNSRVSPLDGANMIWDAKTSFAGSEFHELDEFIYAASEMPERPDDREFFETAIREAAKKWSELDTQR